MRLRLRLQLRRHRHGKACQQEQGSKRHAAWTRSLLLCHVLSTALAAWPTRAAQTSQGAAQTVPQAAAAPSPAVSAPVSEERPYLLLVSIDGYRHDYTDRYKPYHIGQFIAHRASRAQGLLPIFPSLTFPNHYSIITGLYAGHHGIVANHFFNRSWNREFMIGNSAAANDGAWYGGTPLWVLAERQNVKSACVFWPGSAGEIGGVRPTYYRAYDPKLTNRARIDQLLSWLALPASARPHFLTLYFSDVDSAGHHFGPESATTAEAVQQVDAELGYLFAKLGEQKLPVNVVLVSDHGMQAVSSEQFIYLADLITPSPQVRILGDGAFSMIYAPDSKERQQIASKLKKHPALAVYTPEDVPLALHYRPEPAIAADLVVSAQAPYFLMPHHKADDRRRAGEHGYDPRSTPSMQGIFYARGPQIKEGLKLAPFENIHLYPLFARILGLKLPPQLDARNDIADALYRASPAR